MPSPSGTRCWPLVSTARSSRRSEESWRYRHAGRPAANAALPCHFHRASTARHATGKLFNLQTLPPVTIGGMPVRLIALDIDGTLLDSRWQVSEANRNAIAEAARRGIEVALVTGRRFGDCVAVGFGNLPAAVQKRTDNKIGRAHV